MEVHVAGFGGQIEGQIGGVAVGIEYRQVTFGVLEVKRRGVETDVAILILPTVVLAEGHGTLVGVSGSPVVLGIAGDRAVQVGGFSQFGNLDSRKQVVDARSAEAFLPILVADGELHVPVHAITFFYYLRHVISLARSQGK